VTGAAALRLDRLATLYVARPLIRRALRPAILMYHSISAGSAAHGHSYYETRTSPATLARQFAELAAAGLRVLPLGELVRELHAGVPAGSVAALTFDDGYQDFATEALPLLQRHGLPATVFLPTAFISDQRRRFNDRPCLTWPEVRALHAAGVAFGSHTVSHRQLVELPRRQIEAEVRQSKDAIEQALGAPVEAFSYPYAFPEPDRAFAAGLRSILQDAGYRYGVTTIIGTVRRADDPFFLPRLPVNDGDDAAFLRAKLDGAYDWLHGPQYTAKAVKARIR
jgi:peptidoglycan/xylan/chitin deacetylase (PgdA/CDA1 family)